jgi:hypothetical protein
MLMGGKTVCAPDPGSSSSSAKAGGRHRKHKITPNRFTERQLQRSSSSHLALLDHPFADDRTLSRRGVSEKLYRIGKTVGGLELTIPPRSFTPRRGSRPGHWLPAAHWFTGRKPVSRNPWNTLSASWNRPRMSPFGLIAVAPVKMAPGKSKLVICPPLRR